MALCDFASNIVPSDDTTCPEEALPHPTWVSYAKFSPLSEYDSVCSETNQTLSFKKSDTKADSRLNTHPNMNLPIGHSRLFGKKGFVRVSGKRAFIEKVFQKRDIILSFGTVDHWRVGNTQSKQLTKLNAV